MPRRRPAKGWEEMPALRVPEGWRARLAALAEADGIAIVQARRQALAQWMQQREARERREDTMMETRTREPEITASWITPPECAGQTVELSYGQDDEGQCWERIIDHSGPTTTYRALGHATEIEGGWEPQNRRPECSASK